ncbi:MAG: threonine-phosphate decarboxylase CobD [Pseudomonadota bacterium]
MSANVRPLRTTTPTVETGSLPRIDHGGNLDEARARFPNAPTPWIDLSTGINPTPYPVPDIPAGAWTRLPTTTETNDLIHAAAYRYQVSAPESIVAAPGTQALIQTIPRLLPTPTEVAVLGPTYAEHAHCWRSAGHTVRTVSDLEDIDTARVVVCVNPNNPTGDPTSTEGLRSIAQRLHRRGGLLVLDEAFADITPHQSLAADRPPSTLILRSFGKFYGLAGLRLGFAITNVETATALQSMLGPWAVSGPAITIATRAFRDDAWHAGTRHSLKTSGDRLNDLLKRADFKTRGHCPLFRLGIHEHAQTIATRLGENGIHVRTFTENLTWLRFGLPSSEEEWQRLDNALSQCRPTI